MIWDAVRTGSRARSSSGSKGVVLTAALTPFKASRESARCTTAIFRSSGNPAGHIREITEIVP